METINCRKKLIKPLKSSKQPERYLCVSAVMETDQNWETGDLERKVLAWSMAQHGRTVQAANRVKVYSGLLVDTFWGNLYRCLERKSNLWIWCLTAWDTFAALGIWEQVKRGELLSQVNETAETGLAPGRYRWRGLVIGENPPTVIKLLHPRSNGTLTIVDPANFGVRSYRDMLIRDESEPDSFPDDRSRASWQVERVATWSSALSLFMTDVKIGPLAFTAAGQALNLVRHNFVGYRDTSETATLHVHDYQPALDLERAAYYGGRCECNYLGTVKGPIYHLDLNSSYGAAMAESLVPVELLGEASPKDIDDGLAVKPDQCLMADVTIAARAPLYPLRIGAGCHLGPKDGLVIGKVRPSAVEDRVIFPIGKFRTCLAWPELAMALCNHEVLDIHRAYLYRCGKVLQPAAMFLYHTRTELRRIQQPGLAMVASTMLQSLAGKFGQRRSVWVDVPDMPAGRQWGIEYVWDPYVQDIVPYRYLGGLVQRLEKQAECPHSMPAIAAHITSQARLQLAKCILIARPKNTFYWDTDSVWVNHIGYRKLKSKGMVDPLGLGKLKLVGEHNSVQFLGIKHYICDGKRVAAGVPVDLPLTPDERLLSQETPNAGNAARLGQAPGIKVFKRWTQIRQKYQHGTVNAAGAVSPFTLTGE